MGGASTKKTTPLDIIKFRARLREARGSRTMKEVAAAVGLSSKQAYQAYESGRVVPKIDLCEEFARKLGVDPAWLAGWK